MKKNRISTLYFIVVIMIMLLIPLLLGLLLSETSVFYSFTKLLGKYIYGSRESWFNFFSNYFGALVGILGIFIAFQLEQYRKNKEEKQAIDEKNKKEIDIEYHRFTLKYYFEISAYVHDICFTREYSQEKFDKFLLVITELLDYEEYCSEKLFIELRELKKDLVSMDTKFDASIFSYLLRISKEFYIYFLDFHNKNNKSIKRFKDFYPQMTFLLSANYAVDKVYENYWNEDFERFSEESTDLDEFYKLYSYEYAQILMLLSEKLNTDVSALFIFLMIDDDKRPIQFFKSVVESMSSKRDLPTLIKEITIE